MLILILTETQYLQNAVFSFEKTKISISMKIIYQSFWQLPFGIFVVAALLNK